MLVIDASVANAAGWSEHPQSSACRHFLRHVLDVCHRMILTPPLTEEWHRHQSKYTREWRKSMHARRKVQSLEHEENSDLRARLLDQSAGTAVLVEIRRKDLPLVQAALRGDRIVVSLDEEARATFQCRELNTLMWVNPLLEHERVKEWLETGAPVRDEWKLGRKE